MPSANPRRWAALAVIALAQFMVIMEREAEVEAALVTTVVGAMAEH
jgi:hypothetical protein